MDKEKKLREWIDISPKDAYVISRFDSAINSPDFDFSQREEFLNSLGDPSDPEGCIEAFEDFRPLIRGAEDIITRPGYTYEESALMLGIDSPSGLTASFCHRAQAAIEELWEGLFLLESPTISKPQSDLRSLLGIMRARGMQDNGSVQIQHQYFIEERGLTTTVIGRFFLPLKPLDPEWEHDPAYLRTQIQLWEEYLMEANLKHKENIGSSSPPPVILKPTDQELREAQMLCLYKLLGIPLNGDREGALNSGAYPGWFIEIANREGYLMMPSLATLEISVGQGRDELVAMWPEAFQQWLKDRNLFHCTSKPVKATPAWASSERLNPETMTEDDKRALAWREFDAAQAAKDEE